MIHLTNSKGASVLLTARGAGVVSIVVPDRNGVMDDVVLGYKDEESYIGDGPCSGKIPGRRASLSCFFAGFRVEYWVVSR